MIDIVFKAAPAPVFVEDPLMTVAEVARYCSVSPSTVKTWLRKGQLPSIHVISDARIRRSDLNKFIARNRAAEKVKVN